MSLSAVFGVFLSQVSQGFLGKTLHQLTIWVNLYCIYCILPNLNHCQPNPYQNQCFWDVSCQSTQNDLLGIYTKNKWHLPLSIPTIEHLLAAWGARYIFHPSLWGAQYRTWENSATMGWMGYLWLVKGLYGISIIEWNIHNGISIYIYIMGYL